MKILPNFWKHWSITILVILFCFFSWAQIQQKDPIPTEESKKDYIEILQSGYGEFIEMNQVNVQKLVNDVVLVHNGDTLYCDSAYMFKHNNTVEAFGAVEIAQLDGTKAFANFMRYNGNSKVVIMQGDATLTNGNDHLWSEDLEYNLKTKIGKYKVRSILVSNNQTEIVSDIGNYNVQTKDARFKNNVVVTDPDYTIYSDDLGYNTATKIATFFANSTILSDSTTLLTKSGYYNTEQKHAFFTDRSIVYHKSQYIESDTLDYQQYNKIAYAYGNVIAKDTQDNRTLYCGFAVYNEALSSILAVQQPVMKVLQDNDSFYIKADTFFGEPIKNIAHLYIPINATDSMQQTIKDLQRVAALGLLVDSNEVFPNQHYNWNTTNGISKLLVLQAQQLNVIRASPDSLKKDEIIELQNPNMDAAGESIFNEEVDSLFEDPLILDEDNKADADTAVINTADAITQTDSVVVAGERELPDFSRPAMVGEEDVRELKYFKAYYNVKIYSDSTQGKCDSLTYFQSDSLLRMYINPVVWTDKGQVLGDTIYARLDSSKVEFAYIPKNGIIINRSGPEEAELFDQIQGNQLWAYFSNNRLDSVLSVGDARSIYYLTDEEEAYLGVSEAQSFKIAVQFDPKSEQQRVEKLKYFRDFDQTMTPMTQVTPSTLKLERFSWLEQLKFKNLSDFLAIPTKSAFPHEDEVLEQQLSPDVIEDEESDIPDFKQLLQRQKQMNKRAAEHEKLQNEVHDNDTLSIPEEETPTGHKE